MLKILLIGLGIGAGGILAYFLYSYLSEPVPPALPLCKEEMVAEAVSDAEKLLAEQIKSGRILLLPIRGDGTGRITYLLKERLIETGRYSVVQPTEEDDEGILDVLKSAVERLLNPDEVASLRKRYKADAALVADVELFDETDDSIILKIKLYLEDDEGRKEVGTVSDEMSKSFFSLRYFSCWMRSSSSLIRLLIHLLFVFLLPLALYKVAFSVFEEERNIYNALLLAGITAVDVLFCFIILGLTLASTLATILFILNLPFSLLYNFVALSWLEHIRK